MGEGKIECGEGVGNLDVYLTSLCRGTTAMSAFGG
jgi:hypothetical protein